MAGELTVDNLLVESDQIITGEKNGSKHCIVFTKDEDTTGGIIYLKIGQVPVTLDNPGHGMPMLRSGSITGVSIVYSATASGNSTPPVLQVYNGSTLMLSLSLSTSTLIVSNYMDNISQARDIDIFAAKDVLKCVITNPHGVDFSDVVVDLEIIFDE